MADADVPLCCEFFWGRFPQKKVVFMAPTRPLVRQQMEACFNIVGFQQSKTCELTGSSNLPKRRAMWQEKSAFFATPQVIANDIQSECCDAKDIVCVVVDEAHRATGNHAYCKVPKPTCPRDD